MPRTHRPVRIAARVGATLGMAVALAAAPARVAAGPRLGQAEALGIPTNMFTVMFAMGRLPGWIAHFLEMRRDPDFRIGRPRQVYTGAGERSFVAMDKR